MSQRSCTADARRRALMNPQLGAPSTADLVGADTSCQWRVDSAFLSSCETQSALNPRWGLAPSSCCSAATTQPASAEDLELATARRDDSVAALMERAQAARLRAKSQGLSRVAAA